MRKAEPAPDLYLAPSSRPLLFSYAAALLQDHPAEIVYMGDYAPLPTTVAANLRALFPQITLTLRTDRASVEDFASLPVWMPAILRRNLAPRRGQLITRPADKPPLWLAKRYRTAVIYVTGPFLTKTLPDRCDRIVLREDGLGNYHSRPVGWGKAILRALSGLAPRRHFMGEEPWVDAIELARPEALPPHLRHKASPLKQAELMRALPPETARALAKAFWDGPEITLSPPAAIVLLQPLARLGLTSAEEETAIYSGIADRLRLAGYHVFVKGHPQDQRSLGTGPAELPPFFPMEAWPWLNEGRFDTAVALCSASIDGPESLFSETRLQLVRPEAFARGDLSGWDRVLETHLAGLRPVEARPAE